MAVISTSWERQLVAGHPVLNLVNTLDNRFVNMGPDERLATYKDLLEFLQASDLLSAQQSRPLRAFADTPAGHASLRRVRVLREPARSPFLPPVGRGSRGRVSRCSASGILPCQTTPLTSVGAYRAQRRTCLLGLAIEPHE